MGTRTAAPKSEQATSYEEAVALAREQSRRETLVSIDRKGTYAIVRLEDPERLNALSAPLTLQLHDALAEVAGDSAVRSVVLTGADPGFSASGDLNLMRDVAHPMVDAGEDGASGSTASPPTCSR